MCWSCWIILQETTGITDIFTRMQITKSIRKNIFRAEKTHGRATQADKLKKKGAINEYGVAFYLVIAVIHRLPLGAA